MSPNFFDTLEQAYRLAGKTPQATLDEIVLIGGQALILWLDVYNIDEFTSERLACLASDDIDFLGNAQQVKACAKYWGGKAKLPNIDDATPNSGQVIIDQSDDGALQVIDFLQQAYGIRNDQVHSYSDEVRLASGQVLHVMSPPLCLVSRIRNLHGYLKNSAPPLKAREISRINSVITIVRYYLLNHISEIKSGNSDGLTPLKRVVNFLIKEVLKRKETRQLAKEYDFDFSLMFPQEIIHLSPPMWCEHIFRAIEKYNSRVERLRRDKANREKQKSLRSIPLRNISE